MDADKILTVILDLGRDLMHAGAEVWLVEQRLGEIFDVYGFKSNDIQIISNCIEATVQTNEGTVHTQIREVPGYDYNMEKMRLLARLSGHILEDKPTPELIEEKLEAIRNRPKYRKVILFMAAAFGAANFTMFFNGWRQDVTIVGFVALLVVFIKDRLVKTEDNPLILNTLLAYIMEVLLIAAVLWGPAKSLTSMTAGCIILLISSLGLTSGMRDMLHKNVLYGLNEFMHSLLGTMGIAIGISLALMTFNEEILQHVQHQQVVQSVLVQVIASMGGSIGFAVSFNCKKRVLLAAGVGAAVTYCSHYVTMGLTDRNYFAATLVAAAAAAFYSNVIAFVVKTPPSVFLTTCVCPLLPGNTFYQMVYAIIMNDHDSFSASGRNVFLVCIAIALGYIIIEVIFKYTREIKKLFPKKTVA